MRTTLTLDADVAQLLRDAMHRHGKSMKRAVNDALRAGLRPQKQAASAAFSFPVVDMGAPLLDLIKANALAAELEDQELVAKLRRGA